MNDAAYRPLNGIRVLELAHLIPGPMLGRALADRGADVVKIEPPGGDPFRRFPPVVDGRGVLFEAANRGKRSIELDLNDPADLATVHDLAGRADVIVDGFRRGALARRGFDFAAMRVARPELVVCSISGFGLHGPLADLPAHGLNIDAQAGGSVTTDVDGEPRYAGEVSFGVEVGWMAGAISVAAAALYARLSGEGVWLDVSCWDAAVEARRLNLYSRLVGQPQHGLGERHAPLQSIYRTSDGGLVALMATEKRFWENLFTGLGRDDLVGQFRHRDYADPTEDPIDVEVRAYLTEVFATATKTEWNERFVAWGVAGAALLTEDEVLAHPHLAERKLVGVEPTTGLPVIADPIRYEEHDRRPGDDAGPAPTLGADREAVVHEWMSEVRSSHEMESSQR